MANPLDALECLEFLPGGSIACLDAIDAPIDDLDGLEDPTRGLSFPDFTKAALPQTSQQPISWNQFHFARGSNWHRYSYLLGRARPGHPSCQGLSTKGATGHP